MNAGSARLSMTFSCLGHAYMHLFTTMYLVIAVYLGHIAWAELDYASVLKLWSLGALLVGAAALPAGWIADRWSTRGMMVVFFIGMGASSILCGFLEQPFGMTVGLAGIGLFAAIYHPVGIAWIVRTNERQGKALGLNGVFGPLGVGFSGLIAGSLIEYGSWQAAFIVPGFVSILTGLVLWVFILRGNIVDGQPVKRKVSHTANKRDTLRIYLIFLITMACVSLIFQSTQTSLSKLFDVRLESFGAEILDFFSWLASLGGQSANTVAAQDGIANGRTLAIGGLFTLVYLVGGFIQILGGYLADRLPLARVYVAAIFLQIFVLPAVAYFAGLPLLFAAMAAVLLSTGLLPAENMMLSRYTPEKHQGLAYGMKYVLSFGMGPVAIWFVAEMQQQTGEFISLYVILAVIAAIGALAALFLPGVLTKRRGRASAAPAE